MPSPQPTPQPISAAAPATLSAAREQRDTSRTPFPAPRPAKLLCESGEYLCLLRDVSASGVRVGLFHRPPGAHHAFLELGNGEVFPMLRVREGERQACYRFARRIEPGEILSEPTRHARRDLRIRAHRPALVSAEGRARAVELRDMSQTGACFEADAYLALGQHLVLSLQSLPDMAGWVRWRRGNRFGVMFEQSLRLDELAACALALHPLPPREAHPEAAPLPIARVA